MHRRSKDDEKWQEAKKTVRERDRCVCQICSCLTPAEWKESASRCDNKILLVPTDCMHAEAVSTHLDKVYDIDNIFFGCRFHHRCIDSSTDPVTLEHMSYNKQWYWWHRVKMQSTERYDEAIDYNELFLSEKWPAKKEDQHTKTITDFMKYF